MLRRVLCAAALGQQGRCYTDARTIRAPHPYDQVITAENEKYVEHLMAQYTADERLVDRSWASALETIRSGDAEAAVVSTFSRPYDSHALSEKQRLDNMRLSWMISAYERDGHLLADYNPLKQAQIGGGAAHSPGGVDLDITTFGFTEEDLDKVFEISFGANFEATFVSGGQSMTLRQIVATLRQMYCGTIGYEFMYSGFFQLRNWFRQAVFDARQPLSAEDKRVIYGDLVKAAGFETFLQEVYGKTQRFGLEGGEAFIPAINAALAEASAAGVRSCVVGMPHRGRLNFLVNVCRKSLLAILNGLEGKVAISEAHLSGELMYHLGARETVTTSAGTQVEVDLLYSPSHLEAVNALVLGKTRARQVYTKDVECVATMPILVHGDAAFAAQGSCYEIMGFSELSNFHVGGTLHVVINNQIGSTGDPKDTQAGVYCTALSKINDAPVLHVNGDDVEACVRAARIAARFRQHFHRDIILDIVCYRRNGHTENDLPDLTQPQLYSFIRQHPRLLDLYTERLVTEKVLSAEDAAARQKDWDGVMRQAYARINSAQDFVHVKPSFDPESENTAAEFENTKMESFKIRPPPPAIESGVALDTLRAVGLHITTLPAEMTKVHPVVARTYAARKKGIESGDAIEWCLAELLALGTLSLDGVHVRLSGEDVERGTFTQRHAGITDMQTNLKYFPVATLAPNQALVTITNSSLSEFGVCGFELGYNMENTRSIVIWEAQFGDFANGAQVIFDQFLSCSEEKWGEENSLVLSLPHGYSGAGPEHSSARIERFLQLTNDIDHVPNNFRSLPAAQMLELRIRTYNMQVTYPSTPASYFHLLRRQGLRDFARPLVIFFSKARLRAPNLSRLQDMERGTAFAPVIDTHALRGVGTAPRRVLFCSGQIESIVQDARAALQHKTPAAHDDIALVTLEQLSPFPWEQVAEVMERYVALNPRVEFAWLQEEPKNMGMWGFMRPRFNSLLRHLGMPQTSLLYTGRPASASPSTGYGSVHLEEERKIIQECFA